MGEKSKKALVARWLLVVVACSRAATTWLRTVAKFDDQWQTTSGQRPIHFLSSKRTVSRITEPTISILLGLSLSIVSCGVWWKTLP